MRRSKGSSTEYVYNRINGLYSKKLSMNIEIIHIYILGWDDLPHISHKYLWLASHHLRSLKALETDITKLDSLHSELGETMAEGERDEFNDAWFACTTTLFLCFHHLNCKGVNWLIHFNLAQKNIIVQGGAKSLRSKWRMRPSCASPTKDVEWMKLHI